MIARLASVGTYSLAAALAMGCTRILPPPAAPERVLPAMRTDVPDPAAGEGRVALDVVEGPARVDEVLARSSASSSGVAVSSGGAVVVGSGYAEGTSTRHVCTTPCLVNLPFGTHELSFTLENGRTDTASVMVGTRPSAHRRTLALADEPLGRPEAVAGFALTVAGGSFAVLGFGLGPLFFLSDSDGAGIGFLVGGAVGLVLFAIGIPLMALNPADQREGASVEWYLDDGDPAATDPPDEPSEEPTEPEPRRRRRRSRSD